MALKLIEREAQIEVLRNQITKLNDQMLMIKTLREQTALEELDSQLERLKAESLSDQERSQKMNSVNPKYVLRNYMAQLAIDAADKEDYSLVNEFYTLLQKPYDEQPDYQKWFAKRPDWARSKVGCSMLSCSS